MDPELALLVPALHAALDVARRVESTGVGPTVPRQLIPFLRFTRLPNKALSVTRAALEGDAEFREGVAAAVDPDVVGVAGWWFLARPDGWADELDALVSQAQLAAQTHDEPEQVVTDGERPDRSRSDRGRGSGRAGADEVRQLRDRARRSERRERELAAELDTVRSQLDRLESERTRAVRELKVMERRLAERTAELRSVRHEENPAEGDEPDEIGEPPMTVDLGPVSAAVQELRAHTEAVQRTLAGLADWAESALEHQTRPHGVGATSGVTSGRAGGGATGRGYPVPVPPRSRVRLPPDLDERSPAGIRWLLGRPGCLVLLDGYNVTMSGWPMLSAIEQREVLEQAARSLQHRTGALMLAVFDGEGGGGPAVRHGAGSPIRVVFTDEATEADDYILGVVEESSHPVVVVVSSDRRVRDGALALGAHCLSSSDFVAVLK